MGKLCVLLEYDKQKRRNRTAFQDTLCTDAPSGIAILHDSDLARDVVHDIFASLLKAPDLSAVTCGYLLMAVRNRCFNHIRDCGIRYRIMARYLLDNGEYVGEKWPDEETIASIYSIIRSDISPQARRIMELRFSHESPSRGSPVKWE